MKSRCLATKILGSKQRGQIQNGVVIDKLDLKKEKKSIERGENHYKSSHIEFLFSKKNYSGSIKYIPV